MRLTTLYRCHRPRHLRFEVTLVAVTGWGQEDKRLAREAGFDRHITKPIDIETLDRMVGEVG